MGKKKKEKKSGGKKKVFIALALVAAGLAYYLYRNITKVSIGGATARVHKLNADGVELRIVLSVVNEANLNLDVQTFLGQLFYKGVSQGIVQQMAPVRIAPLSVGFVEFKTVVGWTTLGMDAYQIFKIYQTNQGTNANGQPNPNTSLVDWAAFKIKGTLRAEDISVPIETTIFV